MGSKKSVQEEKKPELPNQCLGPDCRKMLPRGQHMCKYCYEKTKMVSKIESNLYGCGNGIFENGNRYRQAGKDQPAI